MKKILAIFLVLIMVLSVALTSCDKDKTPAAPADDDDSDFVAVGGNDNNGGDDNSGDNTGDTTPQSDWNNVSYAVYAMTTLKIRSSTSTSSDVNLVATVTRGTDLNAIAVSTKLDSIDKPEWYKIMYNNQECYVVGAFVTTNFNDTQFESCTPEVLTIKDSGDVNSPYRVTLRTVPGVTDDTYKETLNREKTSAGQLKKVGANKSGTWFMVEYDSNADGTPETYYIKMTQSIRNYFGLNNTAGDSDAQG